MSIQGDAFKLSRKVSLSHQRARVRDVVSKLSSSTRGYGNKMIPTPMLGLLLYNQEKIKEFAGIAPIEELAFWSEEEKRILYGVHQQLLELNRLCLGPLDNKLPACSVGVNPYRAYPHVNDSSEVEELLFGKADAEEMVLSFQNHPGFELALSNIDVVRVISPGIKFEQLINELSQQLIEAGPREDPEWLKSLVRPKQSEIPSDVFLRHITALICLRDSLANLDQLIYQSLFQEDLLSLSDNDIVDYQIATTNSGAGIWLMFLLNTGLFLTLDTGDLIQISTKPDYGLKEQLCRIEQQTIPLGDLTTPFSIETRSIDENLNSYARLLR